MSEVDNIELGDSPKKIAFDFLPLDHTKHKSKLEKRIEALLNRARIDELIWATGAKLTPDDLRIFQDRIAQLKEQTNE